MTPPSKDSLRIKLGEFLVETLFGSEKTISNTVLEKYAVDLGFSATYVIESLRKHYPECVL